VDQIYHSSIDTRQKHSSTSLAGIQTFSDQRMPDESIRA